MRHFWIGILFLLALVSGSAAQSTLLQGAPWASGHAPMYATSGSTSQPVVQDSGPARGGAVGLGMSEGLYVARGTGTAPYAGQGTGPLGTNWCDYDASTTNATGYHYLCFSPNTHGGGALVYGKGGAASTLPLQFIVNGVTYQFPFSGGGGGVVGPPSTTVGDVAIWANGVGTLLGDEAVPTCSATGHVLNYSSSFGCVTLAASATTDTTNASNISSGTLGAARLPAFGSGDVAFAAAGGAGTIANNAVTNAKAAQMTAQTVKCNDSGSTANASDCSHIAFYLDKNGVDQTGMATGAYTQVTFSTAKFNTGGGTFSSNRWTAPVAGMVSFQASVWWTANAASSSSPSFVIKIIKNSAGLCNGADVFAGIGTAVTGFPGTAIAQANGIDQATAGDVYELCAFGISSGALNNLQVDGNQAHTHWSGAMIR